MSVVGSWVSYVRRDEVGRVGVGGFKRSFYFSYVGSGSYGRS